MLIILVARSQHLPSLENAIVLNEFEIAGYSVSRVALICDKPPPDSPDFIVEATIDHRYCPECFKSGKFNRLPRQNKSGWCVTHQDKNPERTKRKLKSTNRGQI